MSGCSFDLYSTHVPKYF
ncbi:unnamed protein product [Spirodela intermedia]|uniref:Uncharacterized protein n=2 Tax=Spirodela intermedia TaxID=51605 RepID=A0A7I8LG08_SPIIN|nr:unnamed protein product [Spirodela intermedia]CAA6671819.1 unnamed protein product [Spirodela intermedia]CAA7408947.1 unnamed protein product [Spirodela intermedia]